MRLENYLITKKLEGFYNELMKWAEKHGTATMLVKQGNTIAVGNSYMLYREIVESDLPDVVFEDGARHVGMNDVDKMFVINKAGEVKVPKLTAFKNGMFLNINTGEDRISTGAGWDDKVHNVVLNKRFLKWIKQNEKCDLTAEYERYNKAVVINKNYVIMPINWTI